MKHSHSLKANIFTSQVLFATIMFLSIVGIGFYLLYKCGMGLGDNGDFMRVIYPNNIHYIHYLNAQDKMYVFNQYYTMELFGTSLFEKFTSMFFLSNNPYGYFSPHFFLIQISKALNLFWNLVFGRALTQYNLLFLSLIYLLIYAFSVSLISKFVFEWNKAFGIVFGILFIFIFCDQGYLLYFNSFYGEPLQFIMFFLILGTYLKGLSTQGNWKWMAIYFAAILFYGGSKLINVPVSLMFLVAGLLLIKLGFSKKMIIFVVSGCVTTFILTILLVYYIPNWMETDTNYNAVFFGILKNSANPAKDLRELGIDEKFANLAGTHAYQSEYPIDIHSKEFANEFHQKISKMKILHFYVTHPNRFIDKIDLSCKNSANIRPIYVGTLPAQKGRLMAKRKFDFWNNLRIGQHVYDFKVVLSLITWGLFLGFYGIIRSRRKDKVIRSLYIYWLILVLSTIYSLVMPIVGNGEGDLAKHMFSFIQFYDFLILLFVLWLIVLVVKGIKTLAAKKIAKPILIAPIIILSIVFIFNICSEKSYRDIQVGCYVQFGQYQRKDLVWRVIDRGEQGVLLWTNESIAFTPFDNGIGQVNGQRNQYGSNQWSQSSLRRWLNTEFMKAFSLLEQKKIVTSTQQTILATQDISESVGGKHYLSWTSEPTTAGEGYDDAYYAINSDQVFLLDVKQLEQYVLTNHIPYAKAYSYWLRTPYCSNESMVRTVDSNGFIIQKDANIQQVGVLPAIRIKDAKVLSGKGTFKKPFLIQ